MVTDPVADLLIRLQNAARRGHPAVTIPASKLKAEILRVMHAEGFVGDYTRETVDGKPMLRVLLRYVGEGQPIITGMRRISKPGKRVYVGRRDVTQVLNGMGTAILSTSKGLMTDQEARRASLGGEVLCHIW
jgi:small subunit ribosomal protein S8